MQHGCFSYHSLSIIKEKKKYSKKKKKKSNSLKKNKVKSITKNIQYYGLTKFNTLQQTAKGKKAFKRLKETMA